MVNADAGGLDATAMLTRQMAAYVLVNVEPELDCFDGHLARAAMAEADCVVAVTGYRRAAEYADVLLPMAMYAENTGSYLNMEGRRQSFNEVVPPPGSSLPAWEIISSLARRLGQTEFSYNGLEEVRTETADMIGQIRADNLAALTTPGTIPASSDDLQRVGYIPMSSVDSLVRHAPALQQSADVADGLARINSKTARKLEVLDRETINVSCRDNSRQMPLLIDDTVADNCVLIHGGHADGGRLGPLSGPGFRSQVFEPGSLRPCLKTCSISSPITYSLPWLAG